MLVATITVRLSENWKSSTGYQ